MKRTAESFIKDLEEKIDKTLEQLALVQTELEENRQQTQEQVERLKQQLKGPFFIIIINNILIILKK